MTVLPQIAERIIQVLDAERDERTFGVEIQQDDDHTEVWLRPRGDRGFARLTLGPNGQLVSQTICGDNVDHSVWPGNPGLGNVVALALMCNLVGRSNQHKIRITQLSGSIVRAELMRPTSNDLGHAVAVITADQDQDVVTDFEVIV